jgi:hypothetical protein
MTLRRMASDTDPVDADDVERDEEGRAWPRAVGSF